MSRADTATVSVIVPAFNAERDLRSCLAAIRGGSEQPAELIVADDGSTDDTAAVAREFDAQVVATGGRVGPARARNLAARQATSAVLIFFDADVVPHARTVTQLREAIEADATLDAVIGAYDDAPGCGEFLSQYKNLQHCFVHRQGRRDASTFWTGCGAVRREVFLAHGGFSESYEQPSIEDIEFGTRVIRSGGRIVLDPSIQVKHLKRWTFRGMVRTDVLQRAAPWTRLIMREGRLPNDLNVSAGQRISAAIAVLGAAGIVAGTWWAGPRVLAAVLGGLWIALGAFWFDSRRRWPSALVWAGACVLLWWAEGAGEPRGAWPLAAAAVAIPAGAAIAINLPFFRFLAGRRGMLFALAAAPFFLFYLIYSSVTFAGVSVVSAARIPRD